MSNLPDGHDERETLTMYLRMTLVPKGHIGVQGDGGTWMSMPRSQCSDEFIAQWESQVAYLRQHLPPVIHDDVRDAVVDEIFHDHIDEIDNHILDLEAQDERDNGPAYYDQPGFIWTHREYPECVDNGEGYCALCGVAMP